MSRRVPIYRISLVLLSLLALIPQGCLAVAIGRIAYLTGDASYLWPFIPGINERCSFDSDFTHAIMWRKMFVRLTINIDKIHSTTSPGTINLNDLVLEFEDPLTGNRIGNKIPLKTGRYSAVSLDDRLFLLGSPETPETVTESYEFIDNELRPFEFIGPLNHSLVLIGGQLFRIQCPPETAKPVVTTVESGEWTSPRKIVIPLSITPSVNRIGGIRPDDKSVLCLNHGNKIFTVVRSDGKVYFRLGLPLRSSEDPNQIQTYGLNESDLADEGDTGAQWQVIQTKSNTLPISHASDFAIIDDRLTALIVADDGSHRPVGHLCQFDGNEWNELTAIQFPFGSQSFRLMPTGKGLAPYLVATTSSGAGFVYRWESGEIREVPGQGLELTWLSVKNSVEEHVTHYISLVAFGLLPCLVVWVLSQWCTSSTYSFGIQAVRLASLGQRGLARVIDLSLLGILSYFVAKSMLSQVNWFEVAESFSLKFVHPDISRINQTLYVEVIVIAVASLFLVVIQGIWGITPGKWLCGLRTLRTTLRPCGIARSLVREVLLAIDSTYLLWWIPGSLAIGLTERRQRIGDLLGDTIVVTSKSMKSELPKDNAPQVRSFNP